MPTGAASKEGAACHCGHLGHHTGVLGSPQAHSECIWFTPK